MIMSFKCDYTESLWDEGYCRKLPSQIQKVVLRKLRMLNNAEDLNELRIPPANRLECLKGGLKGLYSIRVNDQWRIVFSWEDGDAYDVELIDYH